MPERDFSHETARRGGPCGCLPPRPPALHSLVFGGSRSVGKGGDKGGWARVRGRGPDRTSRLRRGPSGTCGSSGSRPRARTSCTSSRCSAATPGAHPVAPIGGSFDFEFCVGLIVEVLLLKNQQFSNVGLFCYLKKSGVVSSPGYKGGCVSSMDNSSPRIQKPNL